MKTALVAPDGGEVAEIVTDQPWQAVDQQVDPTFNIASRIFVVKVSVTYENVVLMGHESFSGKEEDGY